MRSDHIIHKLTIIIVACMLIVVKAQGQDEPEATIKLTFSQTDTSKTCTAVVMADTVPVTETDVYFYVTRSFSLLPIEKAVETDENGMASVEFPMDLPGDQSGNLEVVAKIEDHEIYGTVEKKELVKWGIIPSLVNEHWEHRSLSASRDKAPTYLIVVSNTIIALIWGTLIYIIYQVIQIRRISKLQKKQLKH